MRYFWPGRVFFEPEALQYPLGRGLWETFQFNKVPLFFTPSHNRVTKIPGNSPHEKYREAKNTLVVGIKKDLRFRSCKPSADYEIAFGTSCPGGCEYCYLASTLGKAPYIRVYVNVDEILASVEKTINESEGVVSFEAAASSDPVAVEHLTGSLAKAIVFFGRFPRARLRFVTKFPGVDSLLHLAHNGHTRFRFSINSEKVIRLFEKNTGTFQERIHAAVKIYDAGYPLGFIIAPVFAAPNWKEEYASMLAALKQAFSGSTLPGVSFEIITHRFTKRAKNIILERFPGTKLILDEEQRTPKYGPYGYLKYVYPPQIMQEIKDFFSEEISRLFPGGNIEYFT